MTQANGLVADDEPGYVHGVTPDDLELLVDRPGWAVDAGAARFTGDGAWAAFVRKDMTAKRAYDKWHICLMERGAVRFTLRTGTVFEAAPDRRGPRPRQERRERHPGGGALCTGGY
jgi:hypothetical protein